MRIDDRLVKQNKEKEKAKKRSVEDDEETLTYRQRDRVMPLNEQKGAFTDRVNKGINTEKSIFDKTAVFNTRGE